eukprot:CAMPEP_0113505248 /NCGR_PEP_ID=MMETSP0014_2-20120614/35201_1 /TAXON_ID=2857 /ORGANISM="Nitzschia sp." /LENGTH=401 /DNA_ID=CAMNT_0000400519 /DNA_START=113 /DNA_END=1318 /DNA_ORIENTATION=+ /assembly_acc=CAM_ASM_000159
MSSSKTTTTTDTLHEGGIPKDPTKEVGGRNSSGCTSASMSTVPFQQCLSRNWQKYEGLFRQLLAKYLRLMATPSGQDSILKVVQYSLWILSRFYLVRRPRGSGGSAAGAAAGAFATETSKSLASLSGEISWARYVLRFFGLAPSIDGMYTGSWGMTGITTIDDDDSFNKATHRDVNSSSSSSSKTGFRLWWSLLEGTVTSKRLGKILAWTMIGYFPLEHAAYLQWKAPNLRGWNIGPSSWRRRNRITGRSNNTDRYQNDVCHVDTKPLTNYGSMLSAWSCRFWLAFILLDIIKAGKALRRTQLLEEQRKLETENDQNNYDTKDPGGSKGDGDVALPSPNELESVAKTQKYAIVRNLLYVLPAIGWSLPKWDTEPWLSDDTMFGLCWLEAVVGFYQQIQATK